MKKDKTSVKKNYLYNLLYQMLVIILPLITTPYLSRVLGASGIGIYGYTVSVVTYFILIGSLGTTMYAQREIGSCQDDAKKRSTVFKEILIVRVFSLSISMLLFFVFLCIENKYSFYYQILLLEILAHIIDISWFFQGIEDFKKVVIKNLIIKLISISSIFIFVKTSNDVWKYVLIYASSTFLGNFTLWFNLKKYLVKNEKLNIKRHLKSMFMLFIPQIAISVYTVLDKTMLGLLIENIEEVGFYEQSQKIVKLSLTIITSLGTVMIPRIANIHKNGRKNDLVNYIKKSFNFTCFLSFPICFGLMSISNNLVPWFYGKGFENVADLIFAFSPIIVFIGLASVMGTQFLIPTKQQNKYTIAVVGSAIFNVLGNLILIPKYAALGAAISSVLAELFGVLIQFFMIKDIISVVDIIKMSTKYILSSLIMFVLISLLSSIMMPSLFNTLLLIALGGVVYIGTLGILKDKFMLSNIRVVKEKIIKKLVK